MNWKKKSPITCSINCHADEKKKKEKDNAQAENFLNVSQEGAWHGLVIEGMCILTKAQS